MKKKIYRIVAVFLAISIFFDAIYPTAALALTGGPTQPEVAGFTPIGTSDMVNTFTGDFNYNIPLLDVGGYPINLSYQSGISMDQEASWVGLGWSLNPGVIQRSMRSLPDDFDGDKVTKEFNMKSNETYGVNTSIGFELAGTGIPKDLSFGMGLTYNNFTGYGFTTSVNIGISSTAVGKGALNTGLGLSAGSDNGVGISPSLSYSSNVQKEEKKHKDITANVGLAYNSRAGLQQLSIDAGGTFTRKENGPRSHFSRSTDISFASPTYVPYSERSLLNVSMSLSATVGSEAFPAHLHGRLEGFFSKQFILKKTQEMPAYGYINSQNAIDEDALMDFNREKDGSFNESTPALPVTNFTYDLYSVSGQGIGGMYRPHRSDMGIVRDNKTLNLSAGLNYPGVEIGAGNTAHIGMNISLNESNTISGKWEKNNEAKELLKFQGYTASQFYEAAYFKQAGEKTAETDLQFFNGMGGFDPVRINLNRKPESVPALKKFDKSESDMTHSTRAARARRNELISLLNAREGSYYADIKYIESYGENNFSVKQPNEYKNIFEPTESIGRTTQYRKNHHISQITTYRSDGAKYVYGIPAYNTTQDERTFSVQYSAGDLNGQIESGLVAYNAGDDTPGNTKGADNYYERTVMPAYAHSYLLTEILSADYVDATGNGPTEDDLGTYTKINYTRVNNNYKWRVPYTKAGFNEGFKSRPGTDADSDDKGNIIYGEKELWYIHSIETKNYVALFTISNRSDAYGVGGVQGGYASASKMKKLKKIELFSKQDLLHSAQPVPLKVVHFEYDYSRCTGVENNIKQNGGGNIDEEGNPNAGGKLTLTSIYFTYGNSKKGKLSPYKFNYDSGNPSYNLKGYDRWGNYKQNTIDNPTAEFPYTPQDASANSNASAWHLTSIQLPSGGIITAQYESDDYAYVQNKQAMQMFKVAGASLDAPEGLPDLSTRLYDTDSKSSYNYLTVQLPGIQTQPAALQAMKNCLIEKNGTRMENLYFKFFLQLGKTNNAGSYEYVPGYAELADNLEYNVFLGSDSKYYGYFKIKEVKILDQIQHAPIMVNPISQAGWCFTRMHLPVLAFDKNKITEKGLLQVAKAMSSTFKSIVGAFKGAYNQMRSQNKSMNFNPDKSFVRLYNPSYFKKGGGSRIRKITISDNWEQMTGDTKYDDSVYGQEYTYTTTDEYGNTISSGVAAYEPLLGGDENPFRQPVKFEIEHKLAASEQYYQEEPYGECFFPGASVGYSKVTVKSVYPENVQVKRHATGFVVSEFYTAKDFPVITAQTTIDAKRTRPNPVLKFMKVRSRDLMTASQGFVVELNDMHGKPKGNYVYAVDGNHPISGVKYIYKTSKKLVNMPEYVNDPIEVGSLDNTMQVMERDGSIQTKMVGVDYDFVADMREQETVSRIAGAHGNLESFLVAAFPAIVPTLLPSYAQERVRFRSAVTTKVINRYGILEQTLVYNEGSKVSTKNTLLDAESGEVLLTETKNQYNDAVYSFTYPAHIAYDGMGPAYRNIGVNVRSDIANPGAYFVAGDEVEVYHPDTDTYFEKAWIKKADASVLQAVDINGYAVNLTDKQLKVIRSGRRNQQNVPVGTVVSKISPIDVNGKLTVNSGIEILNAGANEFSDQWGLFCNCGVQEGQPFNPFVKGTRGNWRKVKSSAYLTNRKQSTVNKNTNVRDDGTFTAFSEFWKQPAAGQTTWQKNADNWQAVTEVTKYSPYGMELENKDALGIYSSAVYGYANTLPLAVSANAKYKQIGFDSFEDYDFNTCKDDHFSYKTLAGSGNEKLERSKSHSGKTSIKVAPNSELSIKKTLIKCDQPE